ncbi:MAG TPA: ABC transporter permease [Vicinamibacterales bacterium]|nr:ABC transporter permease [Vicinamibacterales bacterium]
MSATPLWRRYLRFWGSDPGADVDDEFAFHVETRVDELVAQGFSPKAAREEALRGFGDIQQVKAICRTLAEERERTMQRTQWWADWRHDLRFALRQLIVSPVLTAVLMITIALGIGATVAIFSVLNAVLLRPLPWADSDRLVFVYETWRQFRQGSASVGHFHDWTEQGDVFEHTAALTRATFNLSDGEPERISGVRVTPGYFRALQIPPVLGAYFSEADVARDARLVVLGDGLWRRRFAGDPSIVGRTIRLNGQAHTVVGIAPPETNLTRLAPEVLAPLVFSPQQRANYGAHSFTVIAKLKAGVSRNAAQADMERVTRGIAQREPKNMEGRGVNVRSYSDVMFGDFRTPLYVVLGSVIFVLLIGCVNVANLLLARATTRRREIAIRSAIGGGRWRIVRQLLTESVVLALAGGIAGVGLAYLGIRLFVSFGPRTVPRLHNAGLQPEVLLFALGITLLTGLVFGLAPALRAARENLLMSLRDGSRSSLRASGRDTLRGVLVVGEIAVAVVLLVGAGLFIRSAWRLQQVPLGFDVRGVLSARLALPPERYAVDDSVADAYRRILEQTRAVPGIQRAGASTGIPLMGGGPDASVQIEGQPFSPGSAVSPAIRLITEDYVEAIGMVLVRGRAMTAADMAVGAPPVVVINERLASLAWPGEDPIGKRLSTWTREADKPEWREVVGVVGDVRSFGPDTPPRPELFLPYTQAPVMAWNAFQRSMAIVVRSADDPAVHASSLRAALRAIDSSLPLYDVATMREALGAEAAGTRFITGLLTLLAAAGLVLAAVGIYGVIAYFVTHRTPEIGLRLALGATPRSVLVMVVRHGAVLAVIGIAIGLIAALAATRAVATLLFEISATDPPTYAAGAAALFSIALLACAVPAFRAVRVSPMQSLAEP